MTGKPIDLVEIKSRSMPGIAAEKPLTP